MAAEDRTGSGRLLVRAASIGLLTALIGAAGAFAAFPQDPPNDPAYAPSEKGGLETCGQRAGDDEQHYLYSFIPKCTPNVTDPEEAAGMSLDKAWKRFTPGDGHTVIAYIEGGINWRNQPEELADKVFLNAGELPKPTTPVNDGALNAKDYADTKDANKNGLVDPEDIIKRFSDGRDDDHNGYTDDISGWDFYNDQNDPATLDSEYDHANGQERQAASETNNGIGEAGVCPKCMILPVKAGAEALDRTDDLAQAWLYANDLGADVIVSTTADLGYSTFMRDAVNYIWRHGTVMVEASNDFNSIDHQGGMFWPHVLPGNGMVANTHGLELLPNSATLQNGLTTTYRSRSGFTSWGTHNVFTAATTGGTTSESTPTVGGVMAIVLSYGKKAAREHKIHGPLSPGEAVQVVRATASDVDSNPCAPNCWAGKPGFDLQYGYGRPNVYKAMLAISRGQIPPEAWISSPRWYALYDPTQTRTVPVAGHVAAPRSRRYRWKLEFGLGPEPTRWFAAGRGHGTKPFNGRLGTIDLKRIPRSFWAAAFHLSAGKELETNDQYTVTVRLRVFDARKQMSEDRRAIAVHHDPSLRKGFPRSIGPGAGGESQPVFADLQGRGSGALIFGDSDGRIHAVDGHGRELQGFPALTDRTLVTRSHRGVNPGHEPIFTSPAVGDLFHDGRQEIVATTSTGRVYAWDSRGHRLRHWPKALDTGVRKPAIPRPDRPFARPAIMGASSPPVLANLDKDRQLEIVQAGWDGRLHAWNPGGGNVRGWPVHVTLPPGTNPPSGMIRINDEKLDLSPTLAELDGDPQPELLQRTQYSFTPDAGLQVGNAGFSNIVAYNSNGSRVPGFLLSGRALAFYYGSAQEFVTEGVNNPVTADINGDGRTEIASAAGIFTPTSLYGPDASSQGIFGPFPGGAVTLFTGNQQALLDALNGNPPDDIPVNFTTSGAFGRFGPAGQLSYAEPGSGAGTVTTSLLLAGSGTPINSYMRAFDAASRSPLPGYPSRAQGLDFLGAPLIADVDGDGSPEIIQGGDSSALHAFTASGGQAAGFPKFDSGWNLFAPSVGDLDGDGRNELAAATREGYLMVWNTKGKASGNDEWWSYRHDERNTGEYGVDTRPPGVARGLKLNGGQLSFRAPGDDWYSGTVRRYQLVVRTADGLRRIKVPVNRAAGGRVSVKVPQGLEDAKIRAVDDAGNLGRYRSVKRSG